MSDDTIPPVHKPALDSPSPSLSPADDDHALAEAVADLPPADPDHVLAERVVDLLARGQRAVSQLLREVRPVLKGKRWAALMDLLGLDGGQVNHLLHAEADTPVPEGWADFTGLAKALGLTVSGLGRQLRLFNLLDQRGVTDAALDAGLVCWDEVGGGTYRPLWNLARVRETLKVNLPKRVK